jgi:hypothetical protein
MSSEHPIAALVVACPCLPPDLFHRKVLYWSSAITLGSRREAGRGLRGQFW